MDISAPPGLRIVLHDFFFISTTIIIEYSSMCIKPLRKTLLNFERRTIPSPHSDSLKIYAIVLDEWISTPTHTSLSSTNSITWKCEDVGSKPKLV
jgi:hypothetical protein